MMPSRFYFLTKSRDGRRVGFRATRIRTAMFEEAFHRSIMDDSLDWIAPRDEGVVPDLLLHAGPLINLHANYHRRNHC